MSLKHPRMFTQALFCGTHDPAALSTYFVGNMSSAPITTGTRAGRQQCGVRGIITGISLGAVVINACTNEAFSIYLRVNDTTDYLVTAGARLVQYENQITNFAMRVPIVPTDLVALKLVYPNWVTPPTGLRWAGAMFVKTP